ncbi:isoeugenol synthase 1-like [Olea europaea var. sylvestris]|uniref:isoeugenol synthase 1-like n=1 Tax=Olea europaea var. sylvestris TaxID=158386 RepID=UPI000C1CE058|nr:isoeugenol synthase 1-like [Olea europaea var. sylvestris]XP_022841535.1 isoeugenol synthase 1-like [Olea europaea var. sylvestris]
MATKNCKIMIFGATGYLGVKMVKASISMGHHTYAYVRPIKSNSANPSKIEILNNLKSLGVIVFQGDLDEHEQLVTMLKQVDIVISTLAVPQHLEQLEIISAMKEAGNIKRFVPSEFGNEVDRISGLPPFQKLLDNKKKIRRATEAAGIPFTYVSANSFAAYFVDYLLHPCQISDHATIYGSGEAKAVLNHEEDVAAYTVKAATDPRVANRVIICRPSKNIFSQLDLVSSWEKKTGRTMKRIHVPEEDLIKLSERLPFPDNVAAAILHNIFIAGDQVSFDLTEKDLEVTRLYPDYNYTSVDDLLHLCLVNPPKVKLATFA